MATASGDTSRPHASSRTSSRKSSSSQSKPARRESSIAATDKSLTSFPSFSPPSDSDLLSALSRVRSEPSPTVASPADHLFPHAADSPTTATNTKSHRDSSAAASTNVLLDSLTEPAEPSPGARPLFNDTHTGQRSTVAALAASDDAQIELLLHQHEGGPVALVRQLTEDLARRDADMTEMTRKHEKRERALRRMLREHGASSADIDRTLYDLEFPPSSGSSVKEGRHNGFQEGRDERRPGSPDSSGHESDGSVQPRLGQAIRDAIPKKPHRLWQIARGRSISLGSDAKVVAKGTPLQASPKKEIPKKENESKKGKQEDREDAKTTKSVNSAVSAVPKRIMTPRPEGSVEMDSIIPDDNLPPALAPRKWNGDRERPIDQFGFLFDRARQERIAKVVKELQHDNIAEALNKPFSEVASTTSKRHSTGSILSKTSKGDSPSDSESHSLSRTNSLTSMEMPKDWHEYLRRAVAPSELLSATPTPAIGEAVSNHQPSTPTIAPTPTQIPARSALAEPSPTHEISNLAEISPPAFIAPRPAAANDSRTSSPRPLLLDQVALIKEIELRDRLDKERQQNWNAFLRANAEANRRAAVAAAKEVSISRSSTPVGGVSASNRPHSLLATEVSIAAAAVPPDDSNMLGVSEWWHQGTAGNDKRRAFAKLVHAGIPVALRPRIWTECSKAYALREPGEFARLLTAPRPNEAAGATAAAAAEHLRDIETDARRTLKNNIFFLHGPGQQMLTDVLVAYARRNPSLGYCQGLNVIAGNLLLVLPTAEDAFWVFCAMVERLLPSSYWDASLSGCVADTAVLARCARDLLPELHAHLYDALDVRLETLTVKWLLTAFAACLGGEALFRVWDILLCQREPAVFLVCVAIALLELNKDRLMACATLGEVAATLEGQLTNHATSIDGLIYAGYQLRKRIDRETVMALRSEVLGEEVARDMAL
ncbi:rab-GTPase-TBC domain-containing protein [Lineolata rhizophorae]|uniref:Rab-GTPase-TBC domain-containing protein n=1 Tax=Lineolata rhizophorae TaxID=578093 RepID=A0A6A6PAS5_9PEZI|nr:rab-GTPase-TBC domain-containing protein [Lineolata rhizophorae]